MLKQKLKINYLSLIFAFLVFIYTLFTQGAQLEIDVILNRSSAIFLFVLSKLLILFFSYTLFNKLYLIFNNREWLFINKGIINKIAILLFTYLIIIFYTWPGIWNGDDIFIFSEAKKGMPFWTHGSAIALIHMTTMQIIPIPTSIIFFHLLLLLIILFITLRCIIDQKKNYLLLIPFLFPPIIFYTLHPVRSSTATLMIVAITLLIAYLYIIKRKISHTLLFFIVISLGFIPAVRLEYILISIGLFLIFFLLIYKTTRKKILFLLVLSILTFSTFKLIDNNRGDKNDFPYELSYMLGPLPYLVQAEIKSESGTESSNLHNLNKVFNIRLVNEKIVPRDEYVFTSWWVGEEGILRKSFSKKEFLLAKKSFWKLVLKHPQIYIKSRLKTYSATNSMNKRNGVHFSLLYGFMPPEDGFGYAGRGHAAELLEKERLFRIYHHDIRKEIVAKLFLTEFGSPVKNNFFHLFFWNSLPPFLIILFFTLHILLKKNYAIFFGITGLIGFNIAVFFLNSEASFFFYLPTYFLGYLVGFYLLINFLNKKLKIKNAK